MKLSKKSIEMILDLQRRRSSYLLCFGETKSSFIGKRLIEGLGNTIVSVKDIEENKNTELKYTILIFVGTVNEDNICNIEKAIAILGSKAKIILDLTGIKLSINRRNLALSFIKRYNIDLVKGTKEEFKEIIKIFNIDKNSNEIYLAKKYGFIIVESDKNYLSDGYNEIIVNNIDKKLKCNEVFNYIYSYLIAINICHCEVNSEILLSSIIQLIILNDKFGLLLALKDLDYFIKEISQIDSENLEENYRLCYFVKI